MTISRKYWHPHGFSTPLQTSIALESKLKRKLKRNLIELSTFFQRRYYLVIRLLETRVHLFLVIQLKSARTTANRESMSSDLLLFPPRTCFRPNYCERQRAIPKSSDYPLRARRSSSRYAVLAGGTAYGSLSFTRTSLRSPKEQ